MCNISTKPKMPPAPKKCKPTCVVIFYFSKSWYWYFSQLLTTDSQLRVAYWKNKKKQLQDFFFFWGCFHLGHTLLLESSLNLRRQCRDMHSIVFQAPWEPCKVERIDSGFILWQGTKRARREKQVRKNTTSSKADSLEEQGTSFCFHFLPSGGSQETL